MTSYLRDAFDAVCTEAKEPSGAYVCLMERVPYYGGPEEGGWWGTDTVVVEYQWCENEELANAMKAKVEQIAKELSEENRRMEGEHCLRTIEWLEARGLDADYLPEPDGPSEYYVTVSETIPTGHMGCRHYE